MRVAIPTRGRPGDQTAFDFLRYSGYEVMLYANSIKDTPFYIEECDYRIFPHDHVGQIRQHILQENHGKVLMVDDDVRFHKRKDDGNFRRATEVEAQDLLAYIDEGLDSYPIMGIAQRFMGQHNPRGSILDKRCLHVMAYNTELLPEPWPEFRLPNSEDTDFQLQVMTRGGTVCISTEYAVDDRGKYREGGCSAYRPFRDCPVEKDTATKMQEFWPGIVTVDKRGQLRVNWRRAASDPLD